LIEITATDELIAIFVKYLPHIFNVLHYMQRVYATRCWRS